MRVLIVGLGSIAKKHINALFDIDKNIEVFALRSNVNASIIENVTNIFEPNHEVKFDFAIISTPTFKHHENIEQLLQFEIPLFIEKPLFSDIKEKENLLNKIKESKISTYVACNLRFLGCINYVKNEIIGKQKINEVNSYCGSFLPDWRPGIDYKENYSSKKEMGGGVHLDLIHEIDYIYWLFGKPLEVRGVFTSNSSIDISAFDYANYCLVYKDFNASVILNYYRKIPKRKLEFLTDKDVFEVDLLQNKIHKNGKEIYHNNQKMIDTYQLQLDFFMREVLPKRENDFNNIFEAYEILKIALNE